MAVRRCNIRAESKDRMRVSIDALIVTERGTLTRQELEEFKATLADKIMVALTEVRYLHVNLSKIKVSR